MCTILHSLHNLNSHSSVFIDTAVPKCVALTYFPPLCDSDGQVVMRKVSSCVLLSYMCLHFAALQAFVLKQHRHNILFFWDQLHIFITSFNVHDGHGTQVFLAPDVAKHTPAEMPVTVFDVHPVH